MTRRRHMNHSKYAILNQATEAVSEILANANDEKANPHKDLR